MNFVKKKRHYSKIQYKEKIQNHTLEQFKPKEFNVCERITELNVKEEPLTPDEMEEYYELIEKQHMEN